jgi:SAM-dependent methyltransferase
MSETMSSTASTTSRTALADDADRALKAAQRAMWGLGDYPAVARDVIASLGSVLVTACGIGPGDRVLDVAAGSGNAAIPAALVGADVVASDLSPALLDAGRREADGRQVKVQWREADAEALPFADDAFDAVMSCVGVMFAPHHQRTADELVRVCRPGGTIGLLNWTPDGFIGRMFQTMKPYSAPPPTGAQPGPLWGVEDHVRHLFADRVTDVRADRQTLRVDCFESPQAFRDFFKACYGPTIAVYRRIGDDPAKVADLDTALTDLARDAFGQDTAMGWEYLLVTAKKRAS